MLTATSADEGCSGRIVRAIFGDAKGVVEGVDGVSLEEAARLGQGICCGPLFRRLQNGVLHSSPLEAFEIVSGPAG